MSVLLLQLRGDRLKLGNRSAEPADLHTPPAGLLRAVSKHTIDIELMLEQIRRLVLRDAEHSTDSTARALATAMTCRMAPLRCSSSIT